MKLHILFILKELLKTFSSQKSFFSSKRLERFILFNLAIIICLTYIIYTIKHKTLSLADILAISGTFFVYAGYNTIMVEKNKNDEKNIIEKD
jgi:uncharacterized membrane protein